jgi:hypothetical protein
MTSIMKNGMDIYVDGRYKGSAWPKGNDIEKFLSPLGPPGEMRDITLYLPLYNNIDIDHIRLDAGARVEAPTDYARPGPIVVYGTSITQGASAANPALAFPAIIARRLNMDHVNLGFSGNGKGDEEIAHAINEIDASAIVLDYWANVQHPEFESTLPPFVDILRERSENVPIFVVSPWYNPLREKSQRKKREIAKRFVSERRAAGDANIHYIEGLDIIDEDTAWCLVEGRHVNSIGFYFAANAMTPPIAEAIGVDYEPTYESTGGRRIFVKDPRNNGN